MNNALTGHIVADFPANTGSSGLEITGYDELTLADGKIPLLLYPVDSRIKLGWSGGTLVRGDPIPVPVPQGVITLSGGRTATLPKKPYYSTPVFRVLFAFDTEARPTTLRVRYDPVSNVLSVDKDCHALIAYTQYTTRAQKLIYTPEIVNDGIHGQSVRYGVIGAFLPPDEFVTHQVQPINDNHGATKIEIYRIVSYTVTTPDGEFEMPPGYPTTGTYPGLSFSIDPGNSLKTQRTHEVGYMDLNGRGWNDNYFVSRLEPYASDLGYTIPLVCLQSSLGDSYPRDLVLKAKDYIVSRGYGCKP